MTVVVYTKKPCVQCDATIRHITARGVEPVQIRIDDEASVHILEELKAQGYQTAPVVKILVDGEYIDEWGGFNPGKLNEHLAAA